MESNFILYNTPVNQSALDSHRDQRKQSFDQEEKNLLFRYKIERTIASIQRQTPKNNESEKQSRRAVSSCRATPRNPPIWVNIPGISFNEPLSEQKGKKLTSITPRREFSDQRQNFVPKHRTLTPGRADRREIGRHEISSVRERGLGNQFAHLQDLTRRFKSTKISPRNPKEENSIVAQANHMTSNPMQMNDAILNKDSESITPKSQRTIQKNYLQMNNLSQIKTPEFNSFLLRTPFNVDGARVRQQTPTRSTYRPDSSINTRKFKSLNTSIEYEDVFDSQRGSDTKDEQSEGHFKEVSKDDFKQLDLNFDQQKLTLYLNKPSTAKNSRFNRSNGFYNYKLAEERIADTNEKRIGGANVDYNLNNIDPPNEQELQFLEKAFSFYNKKLHDSHKAKRYLKGSIALREELHNIIDSETGKFKQKIFEMPSARRPTSRQPILK